MLSEIQIMLEGSKNSIGDGGQGNLGVYPGRGCAKSLQALPVTDFCESSQQRGHGEMDW